MVLIGEEMKHLQSDRYHENEFKNKTEQVIQNNGRKRISPGNDHRFAVEVSSQLRCTRTRQPAGSSTWERLAMTFSNCVIRFSFLKNASDNSSSSVGGGTTCVSSALNLLRRSLGFDKRDTTENLDDCFLDIISVIKHNWRCSTKVPWIKTKTTTTINSLSLMKRFDLTEIKKETRKK